MMQDWANRLDLWGQGQLKAASSPLTIRLEGAASLPSLENANTNAVLYGSGFPATTVPASKTSADGYWGDLTVLSSMHRAFEGVSGICFGISVSASFLEATVNTAAVARHHGIEAFVNMS